MSLTIDNNRLAQQRALPPQLAQAQTTTPTATQAANSNASANQAPALIGGNAGLTSDLLSVLLQEQSGATAGSSGPRPTLAGLLDSQDQTQTDQSRTGGIPALDPSAAAQSATSTDSFMSGLQDLLTRLKAVG